jgi:hypothetical protein
MNFDIAGFAVRRWQFTLVAFSLLAALGLNAFFSTPRSEDPHFPLPIVIVQAVLPGAEPSEVEQLVVDPIEQALDGLDSVAQIRSTSQDGVGVVDVEFSYDVDPERKYDEVVREGWVLWSEMARTAIFRDDFRASVADRSSRWVGLVANLIGTAQEAGRVPADVDPVSAALRLTSMVDGLGSHVIVGSVSRAEARRTLDIALQEMLHLPDGSAA